MPGHVQRVKHTKVELDTAYLLTEATKAKQAIFGLVCNYGEEPQKTVTVADLLAPPPAPPAAPPKYPDNMVDAAKQLNAINDRLQMKCQHALEKYNAALAGHQAFSEDTWAEGFTANARIEAAKFAMEECQQTIATAQEEAKADLEKLLTEKDIAALGIDPADAKTAYDKAADTAKLATEKQLNDAQNRIKRQLNNALIEMEKQQGIAEIKKLNKEELAGSIGTGSAIKQELANKDIVTTTSGKLAQVDKKGAGIEVILVGKDSLNLIVKTHVHLTSTKDIRDLLQRVKAESGLESVTISARIQHVDIHGKITGYEDSNETLKKMYIEAHKMGFRNVNISPQCHWKPDQKTIEEVEQIKQARLANTQKAGNTLQEASALTVNDKQLNYYKTLVDTDRTRPIPAADKLEAVVKSTTDNVTQMVSLVAMQMQEINEQLKHLQKDKETGIECRTRASELMEIIDNATKCIDSANNLANKSPLKEQLNNKPEFKKAIDGDALSKFKSELDKTRNSCNELLKAGPDKEAAAAYDKAPADVVIGVKPGGR